MNKFLKNKFKIKLSKINLSIIITIISGVLIGVFSTSTLKDINILVSKIDKNYIKVFLNAFSLNYWYFFLIWIFGMIPLGFLITYFITFFRSFILGITLALFLKSSALFGIITFLLFIINDCLVLIPILIYIANASINYSLIGKKSYQTNPNLYFKKLIRITILIILYAILTCLKMTFLEA